MLLTKTSISRLIVALLLQEISRIVRNTKETFKVGLGKIFRNIQAKGRKFISYIKKHVAPETLTKSEFTFKEAKCYLTFIKNIYAR